VRAASVYVAVLFLPMALAGMVWTTTSHWCRRLVDTLVALVVSKFVIVAILSLAAGDLSAGAAPGSGAAGFAALLSGGALLLLAAYSPFTLLKLVPMVESGAVHHLEAARHRMTAAATAAPRSAAALALRHAGSGTFDPGVPGTGRGRSYPMAGAAVTGSRGAHGAADGGDATAIEPFGGPFAAGEGDGAGEDEPTGAFGTSIPMAPGDPEGDRFLREQAPFMGEWGKQFAGAPGEPTGTPAGGLPQGSGIGAGTGIGSAPGAGAGASWGTGDRAGSVAGAAPPASDPSPPTSRPLVRPWRDGKHVIVVNEGGPVIKWIPPDPVGQETSEGEEGG
jgi:hypothetical protein